MTVKQFIASKETLLNRSAIAFAMHPDNKTAPTHLNKKLNGSRKWSAHDEEAAVRVLKELCVEIENLEPTIF